jgi:hypothetical protein
MFSLRYTLAITFLYNKKYLNFFSNTSDRKKFHYRQGFSKEGSYWTTYRVSQNSRIPNSERGREGPSGARKILRKKNRAS